MKTEKEQVKQYMLRLISVKDKALVKKTMDSFGKARSTVYNYLSELLEDGYITKNGEDFTLTYKEYRFAYKNGGTLSESRICSADFEPLISAFPKNVISVWRYAFMEMMNNAIEHSRSENIYLTVRVDTVKTTLLIEDDGVGIFQNIREYVMKESGEDLPIDECAALLFAGKFTTAKSLHSGEGIFFTSHMMDDFLIVSDNVRFTRDNFHDELFSTLQKTGGTLVAMTLYNSSKKTAREVFDRFSNVEEGFVRTAIPIAHFFPNGDPISRSEARRLGEVISGFREVELDFAGTEEVGQAFVHELFVVWQRSNPEIHLTVQNVCENVDFMIRRVLNTK